MNKDVALVLEGGGFRGCYTAGALKWLYEHGLQFDYTAAISATAVHAFFYVTGRMQEVHDVSVYGPTDPHMIGIVPLFTEGCLAGFNYMADHYVKPYYADALKDLLASDKDLDIGVFNMNTGEVDYKNKHDLDPDVKILKASCTLPIFGRKTEVDGNEYLDGGIQYMVSIKRAMDKGYKKALVIVTKDKNYVRKPTSFLTNILLRTIYHAYPKMLKKLDERTDAYYEQMDTVYKMEEEGNAILIRPSRDCGVKRFSGTREQLEELFQLGWQDMEDKKEEIMHFLGVEL